MKTIIVVLEGMPGSGKTEILNEINLMFGKLVKCFAELYHPENLEIEKRIFWYLNQEKQRTKRIKEGNWRLVLLDRGYASIASYELSSGNKENYNFLKKKVGDFYKANLVYFFDTSPITSLKRRNKTKNKEDFFPWFDPKFLKVYRVNSKKVLNLYKKSSIKIINDSMSLVTAKLVIEQNINELISKRVRIDISIVICTRNRASSLKRLLNSINKCDFPKDKFEVIVIDNGSTDHTKKIVEEFNPTNWNLRYYFDSVVGLSHARNLGVNKSFGEIVGFLDDDTTITNSWLSDIKLAFKNRLVMGIGGKVELVYEKNPPFWVTSRLELFLSKLDYGEEKILIIPPDYIVGANMAFRKKVFEKVGFFSTNLGRVGNKLLSAEELEFGRRMLTRKLHIYYDPRAIVYHHVPKERLNRIFFIKRFWWQGISERRLNSYYKPPKLRPLNLNQITFFEKFLLFIKKIGYLFDDLKGAS